MTTDMTNPDNLKAAVREAGEGGLPVWGVYTTDVYESAFGDGYHEDLERLFLKEATARCWGDWISDFSGRVDGNCIQTGYATKIRELRLILDGESLLLTTPVTRNRATVIYSSTERVLSSFAGSAHWPYIIKRCRELWPEAHPPEEGEKAEREDGTNSLALDP